MDTPKAPVIEAEVYSVDDFCAAHRISRNTFYRLEAQGIGPATIKVGKRRLVSKAAAAEWRQRMEQRTTGAA